MIDQYAHLGADPDEVEEVHGTELHDTLQLLCAQPLVQHACHGVEYQALQYVQGEITVRALHCHQV